MKKVIINNCYGGFNLSDQAMEKYGQLKGLNLKKIGTEYYINGVENEKYIFDERDIKRDDPYLIEVVSTLKKAANGFLSDLKIVEIPQDVRFIIEDYDGLETVVEKRRRWN